MARDREVRVNMEEDEEERSEKRFVYSELASERKVNSGGARENWRSRERIERGIAETGAREGCLYRYAEEREARRGGGIEHGIAETGAKEDCLLSEE